jgi:plastocyanin
LPALKRRAISTQLFVGVVVVLLVASVAEGAYFLNALNQSGTNLTTVVSQLISPTTITQSTTVLSTLTQTLFGTGSTATDLQTVTVTSTIAGYKPGLFFNDTLVIIPKGVAENQSENFVPSQLKLVIGVNNTVTWINQDNLSQHTVVTNVVPQGANQVDLILGTNETYTVKFTVPGTYDYYCMWHPAWMHGSITVLSG